MGNICNAVMLHFTEGKMFNILMALQNLRSVKSHVECKIRSYVENHSIKIRYSKGYSSSPS